MRKKVIKAHKGMAHIPKTEGQRPPTKGRGRPPTGGRMIGLPQRFRGGGRRPSTQKQNLPAWAGKQALEEKMLPQESMVRAKPEKTTPLSKAQKAQLETNLKAYRRTPVKLTAEDRKKQYEAYRESVKNRNKVKRGMIPQLPPNADPSPSWATKSKKRRVAPSSTQTTVKAPVAPSKGGSVLTENMIKKIREIQDLYKKSGAGAGLNKNIRALRDTLNKNKNKVKPVYEKPNRGRRFLIRPDVAPPPSESVRAPAPQTLRPILPQVRYKGGYVSRAKYGQVNNLKKKK